VQNQFALSTYYSSKIEDATMSNHFERLENLCNALKKRVVSVLVDKNMIRVKELLPLICGFYRECKSKASALANWRESTFSTESL
jgi:hypothetical protein